MFLDFLPTLPLGLSHPICWQERRSSQEEARKSNSKIGPLPRLGQKTVRSNLSRIKKQSLVLPCQQAPMIPESYVLCERSTGVARFRIEAASDGSLPVEKMAGLLAVHCLVRGQAPEDYELMVISTGTLFNSVAERTQELLAAGREIGSGIKISRREQEVLDGILRNHTNKEIASELHVAERTVKFHVSSLLAKFGVTDRMALSREVALGRTTASSTMGAQNQENSDRGSRTPALASMNSGDMSRDANRLLSMPGRERYAT